MLLLLFVEVFRFVSLLLPLLLCVAPMAFKPMASDPFHGNVAIDDFCRELTKYGQELDNWHGHSRGIEMISFSRFRYRSNFKVRIVLLTLARVRYYIYRQHHFFSFDVYV